ncbi:STE20-related kinase adapter protein alpha-like isoform X3 [Zophobas morio]|uniref:STE20-related kinase adapter protein alpha-like isoform X3 n=1 Tax=Zophobas morio TaxID=2755281 RepID=UPI003082BEBF
MLHPCKERPVRTFTSNPQDYTIINILGNRQGPTVLFLSKHLQTGIVLTIKRTDLDNFPDLYQHARRDLHFASQFRHPNISSYLHSFIAGSKLWVIMKPMNFGSAQQLLQSCEGTGLRESAVGYIMHEVLQGLKYLHAQGILHRRLRASSVLLNVDGTVQLSELQDVALVTSRNRRKALHEYIWRDVDVPWLAPEILAQDEAGYNEKADVYSFAITLLELVHNFPPYSSLPSTTVYVMKMTRHLTLPPRHYLGDPPKGLSKKFRQVVLACLQRDPTRRPSTVELVAHTFWKRYRGNPSALRCLSCRKDYLVKPKGRCNNLFPSNNEVDGFLILLAHGYMRKKIASPSLNALSGILTKSKYALIIHLILCATYKQDCLF